MSTSTPIHPRHGRSEPGTLLRWVMVTALLGVSVLVVVTGIRTAHLGDLSPIRRVHAVSPIAYPSPPPTRATASHTAGATAVRPAGRSRIVSLTPDD